MFRDRWIEYFSKSGSKKSSTIIVKVEIKRIWQMKMSSKIRDVCLFDFLAEKVPLVLRFTWQEDI